MAALERDREVLDRLGRTSADMVVVERRALHLAQSFQRRIDRALELHAPDTSGDCLECGQLWPCVTVLRLGGDR